MTKHDIIPAHETHLSTGFYALLEGCTAVRKEFYEQGQYTVRTHYQPTDWAYEESDKTFWDGLDPNAGTCPKCFACRTAAGGCWCSEAKPVTFDRTPTTER
jgi:hypothetical protein